MEHGEVNDEFYILRRIAYYDCEHEEPGHQVTIHAAELRLLFETLDKVRDQPRATSGEEGK